MGRTQQMDKETSKKYKTVNTKLITDTIGLYRRRKIFTFLSIGKTELK